MKCKFLRHLLTRYIVITHFNIILTNFRRARGPTHTYTGTYAFFFRHGSSRIVKSLKRRIQYIFIYMQNTAQRYFPLYLPNSYELRAHEKPTYCLVFPWRCGSVSSCNTKICRGNFNILLTSSCFRDKTHFILPQTSQLHVTKILRVQHFEANVMFLLSYQLRKVILISCFKQPLAAIYVNHNTVQH